MQGLIGGLQTGPALIRRSPVEQGIAVELAPLGARSVLGVPAGELTRTVVDVVDVLGQPGAELVERLMAVGSWAARFAVLDEFLTAGLREVPGPGRPEIGRAWSMVLTDVPASVEAVARQVGWSRRYLTERFRSEVGLAPRQLRRVIRFERSYSLLRADRRRTLSDVAAEAGFFDQAHMNHEWATLAGCTPAQWVAEELATVPLDTRPSRDTVVGCQT